MRKNTSGFARMNGKKCRMALVCVVLIAAVSALIYIFVLSRGLKVELTNAGRIRVKGLLLPQKSVNIPERILGREVAFADLALAPSIEQINVPSSVELVYPQGGSATNLKEINVSPENPNLSSQDGVLFIDWYLLPYGAMRQGERIYLLCYPPHKAGEVYYVPESVRKISMFAFKGCKNLREVHIPSSVFSIEWNPFELGSVTDLYYHGTQQQWESINWTYTDGRTFSDIGITVHFVGE